jgi:hypothetical protein
MNRRGFLTALIGAATLDPERLLWVPGKKSIFIPPVRSLDLNRMIVSETLKILGDHMLFNQYVLSRPFPFDDCYHAAWGYSVAINSPPEPSLSRDRPVTLDSPAH